MCRPSVMSTADDIAIFRSAVKYFGARWVEFDIGHEPPKLHNLLGHAANQLEQFGNLGDFSEEHIERMHSFDKKSKRVMANIRSWETQSICIQKRNSQYIMPEVTEAGIEANAGVKRNYASVDGISKLARKRNNKINDLNDKRMKKSDEIRDHNNSN